MRFYHAAPKETMMKIYVEGVLKKSWDGVVYMCKDPIDACKFLVIRGMRQMSVIELELDVKKKDIRCEQMSGASRVRLEIH